MSSSNKVCLERIARSLLFVPGDRPDRFEKAVSSGAHEVIIDLEDAVSPSEKGKARDEAAAWLSQSRSAVVRINAADTSWFREDISMVQAVPSTTVMLPKADPDSLVQTAAALPGRSIIALLETQKGYFSLRQMASVPGLSRIAFGSVDFSAETGIADEGEAMTAVRTQIVLESCHAGLAPPIDGVSVAFNDEELMRSDAIRSRKLGFGGKLCIHPRQVALINSAFRPEASQVEWAQRILAAFKESNGAATTVDGVMVDKPVVEQARRIVAEADEHCN